MTKTFVTGEVLTASDVNTYLVNNGYQYAGTRYYTSSGTFAKADPLGTGDIGLRAIRVRMVGAGGGGGGAAATGSGESSCAGGGGGGAYSEKWITDIAGLSASETITRGSGGAGGNAGANAGSNGGTSSAFTVTAPGGDGASPSNASSGAAYTASRGVGGALGANADFTVRGGWGESGWVASGDALVNMNNRGGDAGLLYGTGDNSPSSNTHGEDGELFGGGGSGGRNRQQNQTAKAGGNGANGIVIIDCYV